MPEKLYIVSAFSKQSKETIYVKMDGDGHSFFYPDTFTEVKDRDDADGLTFDQAKDIFFSLDSLAETRDENGMWISEWKIERK